MNSTGKEWSYFNSMHDKENYNHTEMRTGKDNGFSTPRKTHHGFVNMAEAFATPASVFQRRSESLMGTPFGRTASRIQEHDPDAPNLVITRTEDLPSIQPNVTIEQIYSMIKGAFEQKGNQNWLKKHEAIIALRVINKNYPDEIFDVFMHFGNEIIASLDLKSPIIHKSILLFIYEVFSIKRSKPLDERITEKLIPILLNRSRSSSKEVRALAKDSLLLVVTNHISNKSMTKLAEIVCKKDTQASNDALFMLGLSIGNLGDQLAQVSDFTLKAIFMALSKTVGQNHGRMTKLASGGAKYMNEKMGFENYAQLLKIMLDDKHITLAEANAMVDAVREIPKESLQEKVHRQRNHFHESKMSVRKNEWKKKDIEIKVDRQTAQKMSSQNSYEGGFFGQGPQNGFFQRQNTFNRW